jgi:hypothetical protein
MEEESEQLLNKLQSAQQKLFKCLDEVHHTLRSGKVVTEQQKLKLNYLREVYEQIETRFSILHFLIKPPPMRQQS